VLLARASTGLGETDRAKRERVGAALTLLADGEEVRIIDRPRPRPIPNEDNLIAMGEE